MPCTDRHRGASSRLLLHSAGAPEDVGYRKRPTTGAGRRCAFMNHTVRACAACGRATCAAWHRTRPRSGTLVVIDYESIHKKDTSRRGVLTADLGVLRTPVRKSAYAATPFCPCERQSHPARAHDAGHNNPSKQGELVIDTRLTHRPRSAHCSYGTAPGSVAQPLSAGGRDRPRRLPRSPMGIRPAGRIDTVIAWIRTNGSFTARRSARRPPLTPSTARTTRRTGCVGRSSSRVVSRKGPM